MTRKTTEFLTSKMCIRISDKLMLLDSIREKINSYNKNQRGKIKKGGINWAKYPKILLIALITDWYSLTFLGLIVFWKMEEGDG